MPVFHPVLSLLISALFIGLGAGMPVPALVSTVEKGAEETLQGIVLLIGLGSNIILCDSSFGRFGNWICFYSTICRICACC